MTINPTLDTRYQSKDGTFQVIVRIRHRGKVKDHPTGWKIEQQYWNGSKVVRHRDAAIINSKIAELVTTASNYKAECKLYKRPINLDFIFTDNKSYSFSGYLFHRAKQYAAKEMFIMQRKALRFDRELRIFRTPSLTFADLNEDTRMKRPLRGNETFFDELTQDFLRDYEAFLIRQKNIENTRHKKFEFLGKFYNDAINDGKAVAPNPFKKYKINEKPVKKDKLSKADIELLENVKLQNGPVNDARNMALFSYYCKGTRFENCITFERSQIREGRVHVRTNKGNKFISVKIHSRLQRILDQYPDGKYLFIKKSFPADPEKYIKWKDSQNVIWNRNLKIACALAGIERSVKFHMMRHTFADHLKKNRTDIHVIKESLGHSRTATTEIYLAALGDEELDKEMDKLYGE